MIKRALKILAAAFGITLISGAVALYFGFQFLLPLPNPFPNPREAQMLFREANVDCVTSWVEADYDGKGYYYLVDDHPQEDRPGGVREYNAQPSTEEIAAVEATLATNKPSVPIVDAYATNLTANGSVVQAQAVLERAVNQYQRDGSTGYKHVPQRLLYRLCRDLPARGGDAQLHFAPLCPELHLPSARRRCTP